MLIFIDVSLLADTLSPLQCLSFDVQHYTSPVIERPLFGPFWWNKVEHLIELLLTLRSAHVHYARMVRIWVRVMGVESFSDYLGPKRMKFAEYCGFACDVDSTLCTCAYECILLLIDLNYQRQMVRLGPQLVSIFSSIGNRTTGVDVHMVVTTLLSLRSGVGDNRNFLSTLLNQSIVGHI